MNKKVLIVIIVSFFLISTFVYLWPQRYVISYPYTHEVPYYRQEGDYYCGEACIQMIMSFYGRSPPTQEVLANEAGFYEKWGTPCDGMPKPLVKRGFQVMKNSSSDYHKAYDQLIRAVAEKPVIVLITWEDGKGHYLVVLQCDENGVTCHDPYHGPSRYMNFNSFNVFWYANCKSNPPQPTCWVLLASLN